MCEPIQQTPGFVAIISVDTVLHSCFTVQIPLFILFLIVKAEVTEDFAEKHLPFSEKEVEH